MLVPHGMSQPSAPLTCPAWNVFQNEKCHLLIEHETQKLKALDESHNQNLKEWRDKLRPRKKVTVSGLVGLWRALLHWTTGTCLGCGWRYRYGWDTDLGVHFKELAHPMVGAGQSETCRADCRLESQRELMLWSWAPGQSRAQSSPQWGFRLAS